MSLISLTLSLSLCLTLSFFCCLSCFLSPSLSISLVCNWKIHAFRCRWAARRSSHPLECNSSRRSSRNTTRTATVLSLPPSLPISSPSARPERCPSKTFYSPILHQSIENRPINRLTVQRCHEGLKRRKRKSLQISSRPEAGARNTWDLVWGEE